jgi:murein DD-endopeptidase MepM/ murein hydrolase activator NlpD
VLSLGICGAFLTRDARTIDRPAPAPAPAALAVTPAPEPPKPALGPSWPPTETEWVREMAHDAWLHPLDGPVRRMPIRSSRVFGAERPGERPPECRSGHCGVDIGGEVWGEPVMAVHDGIVDRVQRGPNEEHGGLYVRLAHRGGTVFTQYFHLAAIPRQVQPGTLVLAGQVVGLVGDTGVKESGAHLHFTISVRPSHELPEQFIDPEPLIALWPLRVRGEGGAVGLSSTTAPGLPHGPARKVARRRVVRAAANPASKATAPTEKTPAEPEAAPSSSE